MNILLPNKSTHHTNVKNIYPTLLTREKKREKDRDKDRTREGMRETERIKREREREREKTAAPYHFLPSTVEDVRIKKRNAAIST